MTLQRHRPAVAMPTPRAERLILPAAFITCLGNNIHLTASALLVIRTENSAMAIAWVFIAAAAPQALFSLPFGWLADRIDRRMLCLACDIASGVVAMALPVWLLSGAPVNTVVYVVSFVLSVLTALFMAASNALVKERVEPARLGRFSANFDMANSAGMLLSAAAGGVAVQLFGPEPLFVFNGLSFFASAVCWLVLGPRSARMRVKHLDARDMPTARPAVFRQGMLFALTNVIITVSNVLIVLLVVSVFEQGPGVLGFVDALAGTGMLLAGIAYKKLIGRCGNLTIALAGFIGLALICLLQPNIGPAGMLLFLPGGIAFGLSRIASRTMLMIVIDERQAGRVFGAVNAGSLIVSIAATLAIAGISDATHPRHGFETLSVIVVIVAPVVIASLWRSARDSDTPDGIHAR